MNNSPTAAAGNARLAIVTGASRGLGRGLAAALLQQTGMHLLTLARRPCDLVPPAGCQHEAWAADLADPAPVAARLQNWLAGLPGRRWSEVTLIHNAAVISTPGPLAETPAAELTQAARVNLEAPLLLSAAFLQATAGWPGVRKLLFVSSGLGRTAMAGAASYCATKAGVDHLARALALEEAARPHGARVVSLAPGVIDTDMQVQLRHADPAAFAAVSRFAQFKETGQLMSPASAAAKVLACLARPDFGERPIGDVRDLS